MCSLLILFVSCFSHWAAVILTAHLKAFFCLRFRWFSFALFYWFFFRFNFVLYSFLVGFYPGFNSQTISERVPSLSFSVTIQIGAHFVVHSFCAWVCFFLASIFGSKICFFYVSVPFLVRCFFRERLLSAHAQNPCPFLLLLLRCCLL